MTSARQDDSANNSIADVAMAWYRNLCVFNAVFQSKEVDLALYVASEALVPRKRAAATDSIRLSGTVLEFQQT